jgi:20S proteasome alpha/beta subunit
VGPFASPGGSLLDARYRPDLELEEALEIVREWAGEVGRRGGGEDVEVLVADGGGVRKLLCRERVGAVKDKDTGLAS